MELSILLEIILLGIGLAADAFSVSVTDGLTYVDINKKRSIFIAATFGIMQGLMPLIGYWLVELIELFFGEVAGVEAGIIASKVVVWIAFALLLFVGGKMIIESILEMRKKEEEREKKHFNVKEVIFFGFMTSIDALAAGVALHAGLSTNLTIFLHIIIIILITFALCLVGLFLAKQIVKLFKGNTSITTIIGGIILILLAIWVIVSHYAGL